MNLKNVKKILYNLKYRIPVINILILLILIDLRLFFNTTINEFYLMKFEAPFYDIGTLMSYLICLEHIFVTYYLIIIIVMVYWCLYIFIIDFAAWSNKGYKVNKFNNNILNLFNFFTLNLLSLYYMFYKYSLKIYKEYLDYKYLSQINEYLITKNIHNERNREFILDFNLLKVNNYFFKNNNLFNKLNKYNLLLNYINIINNKFNYYQYIVYKKMNDFLYNNKPKYIYFLNSDINSFSKENTDKLLYSNYINKLRNTYNYIFDLNQFRHSGIFEGVWAFFPTIIILLILIPSLILIYSFEDIINPKMSIKVIGNQWYWTYEMDSWLEYKNSKSKTEFNYLNNNINENEEIRFDLKNINEFKIISNILNEELLINNSSFKNILYNLLMKNNWIIYNEKDLKLIYCSFSFDSVIKDLDSLNLGEKRLLEVDNRLILSTNETIRYLVTAADVLHSFSVPELGLKVDAVPGRLNQILSFINRPGIYYGQCSELCGVNHAFMPIVIEAISPKDYNNIIKEIENQIFKE